MWLSGEEDFYTVIYFVKLENYNCCRFEWRITRKTSERILQIRGRIHSSDLNPVTTKSGKQCYSAEKKIRDVSE